MADRMGGIEEPQGDPDELLRTIVREVRSITCESNADLGRAIGMSGALVGRRQAGTTQWSVREIGALAAHWHIDRWWLHARLEEVLRELPEERVAELRALKGYQPVPFKPPRPVAA